MSKVESRFYKDIDISEQNSVWLECLKEHIESKNGKTFYSSIFEIVDNNGNNWNFYFIIFLEYTDRKNYNIRIYFIDEKKVRFQLIDTTYENGYNMITTICGRNSNSLSDFSNMQFKASFDSDTLTYLHLSCLPFSIMRIWEERNLICGFSDFVNKVDLSSLYTEDIKSKKHLTKYIERLLHNFHYEVDKNGKNKLRENFEPKLINSILSFL
jgi:hypothetical protein